jgi:repressor LexA
MSSQLSERQQNILKYIESYVEERGYPPSIREIGSRVGISSTSVVGYNLSVLEHASRHESQCARCAVVERPPCWHSRATIGGRPLLISVG